MARGRREIPPCCKSYGLPFYCAACVPIDRIKSSSSSSDINEPIEDRDQDRKQDHDQDKPLAAVNSDRLIIALGGGGGEGRSGVPNALILSSFDFASGSLADHPVCRLGTDNELPYRMAMHPGGDGFVCSFPNSCRWFEWDISGTDETVAMKSSEKTLTQLEDVGLQLALAFNAEGSILATGGEDGHLRVFKWPSLEIILDQTDAHSSVKDLDFSSDSKYLVSSGSGPCRVWDLTSSVTVASLQREDGEIFGFCRFIRNTSESHVLYVTAMHGDYGKIISWNADSWKRAGSKRIARDPISAFSVSTDGKFLAMGTVEGNVVIIDSLGLRLLTTVKKAHVGIVTSVVFSQDSRALVSTSFDYTTRVTLIKDKKKGMNVWITLLIIFLSFLVYYYKAYQNQGSP